MWASSSTYTEACCSSRFGLPGDSRLILSCACRTVHLTWTPPSPFPSSPTNPVKTRDVTENAGFFAIRSRNVRAKGSGAGGLRHAGGGGFLGGSPMTPSRPGFTPQSPAAFSSTRQSPYSPGPGGRGTPFDRRAPMVGSFAGRANHARRDNSLVGQTIRIKKGPWCGYNVRLLAHHGDAHERLHIPLCCRSSSLWSLQAICLFLTGLWAGSRLRSFSMSHVTWTPGSGALLPVYFCHP